jgi:SNF2 family DNA or RNA helicase
VKFNVLVTTYEFIMYDRSKLSRIDWKYIIIDEAQRMKDRESVLARDLDRYRCQRRLLLTGTPLQVSSHLFFYSYICMHMFSLLDISLNQ